MKEAWIICWMAFKGSDVHYCHSVFTFDSGLRETDINDLIDILAGTSGVEPQKITLTSAARIGLDESEPAEPGA